MTTNRARRRQRHRRAKRRRLALKLLDAMTVTVPAEHPLDVFYREVRKALDRANAPMTMTENLRLYEERHPEFRL